MKTTGRGERRAESGLTRQSESDISDSEHEAKMKQDPRQFGPLAPAVLHILLALAGEDLHGYGIMQEIARQTDGQYKIGPGTLYDNLRKLLSQGLVEEAATKSAASDPRRRYYRLKGLGRGVLSAEVERLQDVVREARMHLRGLKAKRA
jgi:DNA-binding PadR family transcriptional regulator